MALTWEKHPNNGPFATEIRRGIRQYRREKGRQGHRFRYDDLGNLVEQTTTGSVWSAR